MHPFIILLSDIFMWILAITALTAVVVLVIVFWVFLFKLITGDL